MSGQASLEPACAAVVRLVSARTGLTFPPNRWPDVDARVRRAMRTAGAADLERFAGLLGERGELLDALTAELTVGETYFFRDPAQLELVRSTVLPDLVRRRPPDHVLRAWSAGCATGEEPYSLAVLLQQEGLGLRSEVLGTDLSRPALAQARSGSYGAWSLRGVEEAVVARCFHRHGQRWTIDDRFKRAVTFGWLNLASHAYPSAANGTWGLDLILCRNVLIYLDRGAVRHVAQQLLRCLGPGGWLLTAASDPPLHELAPFESVVTPAGVLYRRAATDSPGFAASARPSVAAQPAAAVELAASPAPAPAPAAEATEAAVAAAPDTLARARAALEAGEWATALELAERGDDAEHAELAVRACANLQGTAAAAERAADAVRRHALAPQLHFLHAVLLLELGRHDGAIAALRRVLYLDDSLAVAHYLLGRALGCRGDAKAARRSYALAAQLADASAPHSGVLLGDGERAGTLAAAARAQAALLGEEQAA